MTISYIKCTYKDHVPLFNTFKVYNAKAVDLDTARMLNKISFDNHINK